MEGGDGFIIFQLPRIISPKIGKLKDSGIEALLGMKERNLSSAVIHKMDVGHFCGFKKDRCRLPLLFFLFLKTEGPQLATILKGAEGVGTVCCCLLFSIPVIYWSIWL